MKRIISLILVFCMIFSSVTIAESLSTEEKRREIVSREGETIVSIVEKFSDMKDHWSTQWVEKLLEKDVISGYPDGTFKPDKAINRAEFTKLLVVALHDDSEVFEGGHWAKNYIEKAIQEGYILEGEFKDVDKNITRAEMARMIARAMEEEPENWKAYKNNIADYTNIKVEYREYVLQVYAAGIVKGLPNGRFAPEKTASRAEASTMLVKLIEPDERDITEIMEEPQVSEEDFIEPQLELKNNDILENYIIHSIVVKNHEDYIGVENDSYKFKVENITYPELNQRQLPGKEIDKIDVWMKNTIKRINHPTVKPKGSIYDLPAFFYTTVEHEKNFHLKEGMKMKYKVTVKKGDIEKEYFVEGKLKFIMDYYKDYPQYKE